MAVDTLVAIKAATVDNSTHHLPKEATEGRQEATADMADKVAHLLPDGIEPV